MMVFRGHAQVLTISQIWRMSLYAVAQMQSYHALNTPCISKSFSMPKEDRAVIGRGSMIGYCTQLLMPQTLIDSVHTRSKDYSTRRKASTTFSNQDGRYSMQNILNFFYCSKRVARKNMYLFVFDSSHTVLCSLAYPYFRFAYSLQLCTQYVSILWTTQG